MVEIAHFARHITTNIDIASTDKERGLISKLDHFLHSSNPAPVIMGLTYLADGSNARHKMSPVSCFLSVLVKRCRSW